MLFKIYLRLSVYADPFHSLLLLPIVLALAHSSTLRNPTGLSPPQSPFGQSSFVGKENGTPAETRRMSEGPETTIPQSFPWRRRRRMPLPNNDAAGYDDSYYVMRHSSLHGWFKSPCERAMRYRVVGSVLCRCNKNG